MKHNSIKVLVVDDSAVIRGLLTRAITQDGEIEVVGTAMHGEAALAWLRKQPADVAILDVEMPVMDGLETLGYLRRQFPEMPVIMASSLTQAGAKTSMMALSMGAAACIAKPTASSASAAVESISRELIPLIKGLCGRPVGKPAAVTKPVVVKRPVVKRTTEPTVSPELLVIGSSTGGPNALNKVLCDLGSDFATPTLIVQHMPPMFTAMMAHHLQNDTGRRVKEAEDGDIIEPGVTYVAPGEFHMEVRQFPNSLGLSLNQNAEEHYCRPSVNPMFRTACKTVGSKILAVMLTGMGSDGLEGTVQVVEAGGYVIAQDEASSVVWGMPGAIANAGLTNEILPLDRIGARILQLCSKTPRYMKVNR